MNLLFAWILCKNGTKHFISPYFLAHICRFESKARTKSIDFLFHATLAGIEKTHNILEIAAYGTYEFRFEVWKFFPHIAV